MDFLSQGLGLRGERYLDVLASGGSWAMRNYKATINPSY